MIFDNKYIVRKCFNKEKLCFEKEKELEYGNWPISRYIWRGFYATGYDKLLNNLIPNENLVIGIQYDKEFDIQIGCSGSPHSDENLDRCAKREIEEELGITGSPKLIKSSPNSSLYFLEITEAKEINTSLSEKPGFDIHGLKAWVIVHGKPNAVIDLLGRLNKVRPSNDYPYAVAAFKKKSAIKWIEYIRLSTSPRNWKYPFSPTVYERDLSNLQENYVIIKSTNIEVLKSPENPRKITLRSHTIYLKKKVDSPVVPKKNNSQVIVIKHPTNI